MTKPKRGRPKGGVYPRLPHPKRPQRAQKFAGTIWQNVFIAQMPRQLVQDAKDKAQRQGSTFRQTFINLLMGWTYAEDGVVFEPEVYWASKVVNDTEKEEI